MTETAVFYSCHINCLVNDCITSVCGLFIDFKCLYNFFTLTYYFYVVYRGLEVVLIDCPVCIS